MGGLWGFVHVCVCVCSGADVSKQSKIKVGELQEIPLIEKNKARDELQWTNADHESQKRKITER